MKRTFISLLAAALFCIPAIAEVTSDVVSENETALQEETTKREKSSRPASISDLAR